MSLFVVATPIGNTKDFSLRALEVLKAADLIIGEELKVLRQTLKAAGVQGTELDQLNEHSDQKDIAHFVEMCRTKTVALVSDCGTPGFCDPGAELVAACAQNNIEIRPVPGPSSLMTLLSVCGVRLQSFLFYGFLPAKNEEREKSLTELKKEKRPFVVMETPYRCEKFLSDLKRTFPSAKCVIGMDLTTDAELILRTTCAKLDITIKDREPIALIIP